MWKNLYDHFLRDAIMVHFFFFSSPELSKCVPLGMRIKRKWTKTLYHMSPLNCNILRCTCWEQGKHDKYGSFRNAFICGAIIVSPLWTLYNSNCLCVTYLVWFWAALIPYNWRTLCWFNGVKMLVIYSKPLSCVHGFLFSFIPFNAYHCGFTIWLLLF